MSSPFQVTIFSGPIQINAIATQGRPVHISGSQPLAALQASLSVAGDGHSSDIKISTTTGWHWSGVLVIGPAFFSGF